MTKAGGPKYTPHRRAAGGQLKSLLQGLMNRQVAGMPMGFWVVVGVAVLAAIGLGISVALGN